MLGQHRCLGERAAERLIEQADFLVAGREAVAQLALLQFDLGRQGRILFLQLAQPANVGAVAAPTIWESMCTSPKVFRMTASVAAGWLSTAQ